ncbi:hypothetical protein DF186_16815, partial [Enterococcus hirae]
STSNIQIPVKNQSHTSTDNNPSKKTSQPTSVKNKPAATKIKKYKTKIPYPQKLRQTKQNKQFTRFTNYLRTLKIKISFTETLEQIPSFT